MQRLKQLISLTDHVVQRLFSWRCPEKASGPDGVSGLLLNSCSEEMAEIYQKSLNLHTVSLIVIIPVPQKKSIL